MTQSTTLAELAELEALTSHIVDSQTHGMSAVFWTFQFTNGHTVTLSPSITTPLHFDLESDADEDAEANLSTERALRRMTEISQLPPVDEEERQRVLINVVINALPPAPADAQATPTPVNVTGEAVAHCPDCDIAVPIGEITDEGRHAECGAFVQPA